MLAGLVALTAYLLPRLAAPGTHWPLWDVHVYWWGGQQAARGGALYAPGARYNFTYPPFAAVLFGLAAAHPKAFSPLSSPHPASARWRRYARCRWAWPGYGGGRRWCSP